MLNIVIIRAQGHDGIARSGWPERGGCRFMTGEPSYAAAERTLCWAQMTGMVRGDENRLNILVCLRNGEFEKEIGDFA